MLLFLYLLIIIGVAESERYPLLSSGSCVLIKDKIYYLLGDYQPYEQANKSLSHAVYSLDLTKGFELNLNRAPWKVDYESKYSPEQILAKAAWLGGNDSRIINIGGQFSNASIRYYDTKNKKWTFGKSSKYFDTLISKETNPVGFFMTQFAFTQNDLKLNEFILYGGFYSSNKHGLDVRIPLRRVYIYNDKKNTWKPIPVQFYPVTDPVSVSYKGKLYFFGGRDMNDKPFNLISITEMDLTTYEVKYHNATGDIPIIGEVQNFYQVKNLIYVVNEDVEGSNKIYPVYTFDLNTFKWKSHKVDGFKTRYGGCLIYYKDHLIYSFGGVYISNQHTQVIDIENWERLEGLPPYNKTVNLKKNIKKNVADSKQTNQEEGKLNVPALVGGLVGGFFLIAVVGLLIFRFHFKKKIQPKQRPITEANYPSYIPAPKWIDRNFELDHKPLSFRHSGLSNLSFDSTLFTGPTGHSNKSA